MAIELEMLFKKVSSNYFHLVAGKKSLNKNVDWFQIIENIGSVSTIEEDIIVFTTGIGINSNDDFYKLISSQIISGSVATVLVVGEYIKEIPQSILDMCDENCYPLFTISNSNEYAKIMHLMTYEILRSEKASIELSSALKDAISFPTKKDSYIPVFKSYGFREDDTYCMAIIEPSNKEKYLNKNKIVKMVKMIEKMLMTYGEKSFIINSEGVFLLLFSNYDTNNIINIVENIVVALQKVYAFGFFVSVGCNSNNIYLISESNKYASKINSFLKVQNIKNKVYEYDKLGMLKILMSVDDKDVLKEYSSNLLSPIITYDAKNRSNLYEILKLYLENDCSVKIVSEILYLHRNSINYKIKKIEELLNCDLGSLKMRTKLYLAFLIEYIV